MKKLLSIVCAATCLTLSAGQALAQAYPTKPIKIIVPFGPGGFTDVVARILGVKLGESLGQSIVIENKPGAGSMIGTDQVAKSAPDGHTLLIVSSTHVISPWIYKNVPYDPIKSFTPVTKLVDSPYVLLTNPKVPAKNVQEFIALAKAQPDKIHYASSGNGSAQHLIGGLFASMTKTQLKHVPYRSSNLATTDVVAGVVESSFAGVPNALSQVPNGRLNALAVTSANNRAPYTTALTADNAINGGLTLVGRPVFSSADAGTVSVDQGSVQLSGTRAANYRLVWVASSASITPAPLTVTANNDARFYSLADDTNYAGVRYSGLVGGQIGRAHV